MFHHTISSRNSYWQSRIESLPPLAQSNHPILLQGESGTGKDVIAREIHHLSLRAKAPYVSVNCAAIQESLVESELFGHRKGSFTGAEASRNGAFQEANKGTLFLDEVGDLPLSIQAKLLRAIENKEIKPVGSDQIVTVDVRIISATHKDLERLVKSGQFRQDLYYRLNVIQIDVPTLSDRTEDIPPLAASIGRDNNVRFSDQALQVLTEHHWPGNIRELKNFILRASALYPNQELGPSEVFCLIQRPAPTNTPRPQVNRREFLRKVEEGVVLERLKANNWNQRQTARELGIPKSTLHDIFRRMQIRKRADEINESSQSDSNTHSLPGLDLKPH